MQAEQKLKELQSIVASLGFDQKKIRGWVTPFIQVRSGWVTVGNKFNPNQYKLEFTDSVQIEGFLDSDFCPVTADLKEWSGTNKQYIEIKTSEKETKFMIDFASIFRYS